MTKTNGTKLRIVNERLRRKKYQLDEAVVRLLIEDPVVEAREGPKVDVEALVVAD